MEWTEDRIFLFITAPQGDRVLVRRLEGASGGGVYETIAVIVRSAIVAMREGGTIGISVAEMEKQNEEQGSQSRSSVPAPPPAPPLDTEAAQDEPGPGEQTAFLKSQLGYSYSACSGDIPAVHGFSIGMSAWITPRVSILLETRFAEPLETTHSGLDLTVRRFPLLLGIDISAQLGRGRLGGMAGLEFLFQKHETIGADNDEIFNDNRLRLGLAAVAGLTGAIDVHRRVSIFVFLGAEIMLHRINYTVRIDGREVPLLETWPIQPLGRIGLEFTIL